MRYAYLALSVCLLTFAPACSTSASGRCRIDVSNLPPAQGATLALEMVSIGTDSPMQVVITNGGPQACYFESSSERIGTIAPGTTSMVTFTASSQGLEFTQTGLAAPLSVPPIFASVGTYSPGSQSVHPVGTSWNATAGWYSFTVSGLSSQFAITVDALHMYPAAVVRQVDPPSDGRNTLVITSKENGGEQALDFVNYGPKSKTIEFGPPGGVDTFPLPNAKPLRLELEPNANGTVTARIPGTAINVQVPAEGEFDPARGANVLVFRGPPGRALLVANYRGLFTEIAIVTAP